MTLQRMDHVGIVVDDLEAATEFFVELGLVKQGDGFVEGSLVDRIVGLEGIRSDIVMLETPDGGARIELVRFQSPPHEGDGGAPSNTRGIRHISFLVDDVDAMVARLQGRGGELIGDVVSYEDVYRLCYMSGPEGIIVELAERIE